MKKTSLIVVTLAALLFILNTAGQAFQVITKDMMEKETVTKTDLIRLVDNVIVLFDTSGSTNEMVPGRNISKIQATKELLAERNAWLPNLGYQAGLYIYTDNKTLMGTFKEVVGMQPYNREIFAAGIEKLPDKGQGPTMLQAGLSGLGKILDGLSGKTAVIMFTDGSYTVRRGPKRPVEIARELAQKHDVSFYLISSGTSDVSEKLNKALSTVNASSRVIPLTYFLDSPTYLSGILFTVKTSSYERLKPVTKVVGVKMDNVLFDFNSAVIRSEYNERLDTLGDYLQKNPDAYVIAAGFADSTGDEGYNLELSRHRADSVRDYLMNKFTLDPNRVVTLWYGEMNPVGDNATDDGRRLNRRVELAVGGIQ
jgi:OmpA-OmpF porin, OOP family